ncbi:site-2 protease family protein [Candidatus Beckwithbacteria bacterium CG_4_10_14_0_2_um_filter_47_25]|uniref:Site-2 protease family protein n=2 Tax=Candidatus Beckwithiibacteriota TaxID=1752726 RepID=A0A2H0B2R1_9BACT|nr:MAG: site-2 protease family protein [Candidatus Beckwithbacteria bacterium CG23_combo_of_CG06-09_8_20_14_all_47_9]PJA23110.1 MAG: site-2 protease family protein [Candidatus Beckwithbacteria bacterium CG_4_10_14_0_2_um_filter_47_25]
MFSELLFFLPALIIAITIHEFAHAWMADRLGDPTPQLQGRLSLNPLKHLDPIGTLMLLFFRFGWGKPVEFDPYNLRHPRRDAALISLAGPAVNLILATALSLVLKFSGSPLFSIFLYPVILININLAIFNLLPVPPLDGAKILYGILPADWADEYNDFMGRYGTILLILLIIPIGGSSLAINLIMPVINGITKLLL